MGPGDSDTRIEPTDVQEALAAGIYRKAVVIDGTALAYTLEPPFTDRLPEAGMSPTVARFASASDVANDSQIRPIMTDSVEKVFD